MPYPAAVLWDMDGTLVDSEPYWMATENALAAAYGATWSHEQALQLVGKELTESGRIIQEQMALELSVAEIVEVLLDGVVARVRQSVPWRPGARELLADLGAAGVPCALVTMSYQRFVDPILAELPAGSFDAVVTGDQVARGKPDPEPYFTAAARLGVDPSRSLAIEDSETGARSAEAAGCPVLVVPHHVPVAPAGGRILRDTLAGITVADLASMSLASAPPRVTPDHYGTPHPARDPS